MNLRRIVDALVGTDGSHASRADPDGDASRAALDDAGHGELDPELFGEALVHYADTAPIEVADALAPIVATASAVPLDPELDPVYPVDAPTGHGAETTDDVMDPDELDDGPADVEPGDSDVDDAVEAGTAGDTRTSTEEVDTHTSTEEVDTHTSTGDVDTHTSTGDVDAGTAGTIAHDGFGTGSTAPAPTTGAHDRGASDPAIDEPPTAAPISSPGLDEPTDPFTPTGDDAPWLEVDTDAADESDGGPDPDLLLDE